MTAGNKVPEPGLPPYSQDVQDLVAPHTESFNFFLGEGLKRAVENLLPVEVTLPGDQCQVRFWIESVHIGTPSKQSLDDKLYPSECRQRRITYGAPFYAMIARQVGDNEVTTMQKLMGRIPIMVKSDKCHLKGLNPAKLVAQGEEPNEMGGYFVCNGLEKLIRLLIVPRSNNMMALKQGKFTARGKAYSPYGVEVRCLRNDQTTLRNTVHYLNDGNCTLRFSMLKQEFFIPVVILLKAFKHTTDREIYEKLVQGDVKNTFLTDRVELLLREAIIPDVRTQTQNQCYSYLGGKFRAKLGCPARMTDREAGELLVKQFVLCHLSDGVDKFNFLMLMLRKMYALVAGDIPSDNPDSQSNQDILLPGHLYLMIVKEKLQEWLDQIRIKFEMDIRRGETRAYQSEKYFKKCTERCLDVGQRLEYFLATGNIVSNTGLDLLQKSGYAIVAEKLNYLRYLAHFRGVHRGQFFSTMKTTKVRKLLPEAWGYLCPVHTPDGAPCGLLNHLTSKCKIITHELDTTGLLAQLAKVGMEPVVSSVVYPSDYYPVTLDGKLVGYLAPSIKEKFVDTVRYLKVTNKVPRFLEVVLTTPATLQFPIVQLFSCLGRMMRPVCNLATGLEEFVGTMEQIHMEIACLPEDMRPGKTTHAEYDPTNILSATASLIPFSDFNQSPRNMFQCQMAKQSMATPCTAYQHRVDNKLYRIQTPQVPLVQNEAQTTYRVDDYAVGTNAVVAVISYTGYDMEDAMIINRSAYNRGFKHGTVYKVEVIDLTDSTHSPTQVFKNPTTVEEDGTVKLFERSLDADGLPLVGQLMEAGTPYVCITDTLTEKTFVKRFKGKEPAVIDQVRVLEGRKGNGQGPRKVSIKLRINRNPIIGDKFSSRHGQKGVLSKLWPQIDMPFSESGLTPDIIINPHAFPSRMTIGMLIESMAAKSAALHGVFHDATPFRFNENQVAVDYFGQQLLQAGYNYYGNEPMYCGTTGELMKADIFLGVVYYQRLRHMVSDKFQVRATGRMHNLTRQPIKGRKLGGGIRLGEMERDSLLSHGATFFLQDRLNNCSDAHNAFVCGKCGGLLSPVLQAATATMDHKVACRMCGTGDHVRLLKLPYVFRYLVNEFAAMNIRVTLSLKDSGC